MPRGHLIVRLTSTLLAGTVLAGSACSTADERATRYEARGDAFVTTHDERSAAIEYRNALAQRPGSGTVHAKLAAVEERLGDLKSALGEYVRAADALPHDVDAQLHAAKLLIDAGVFADARVRADKALAIEPHNVNGLILLGSALAGLKDLNAAISQIEDAIDLAPDATFAYANLGLLQVAKGDRAAAQQAFERAVAADPRSAAAHMNLANYYWAAGELTRAEAELRRTLALEPTSGAANRAMATLLLSRGDRAGAEAYVKAFADASGEPPAILALADFYLTDGRTADASQVLEPLCQRRVIQAAIRCAAVAFVSGHRDDAYATLDGLLTSHPANEPLLAAKGRLLFADGRLSDALAAAKAGATADVRGAAALYLEGVIYEAQGQLDEAQHAFERVLQVAPGRSAALTHLATLSLARGATDRALEFITEALRSQPGSVRLQLLLARALMQKGDHAAAERRLAALVDARPHDAEARIWLGRAYLARHNHAAARRAFERALADDADGVDALNGLVSLDALEGRPSASVKDVETRLARHPENPRLMLLAGTLALNHGDTTRAEALFRRITEIDPANIDAYSMLGGLYMAERRLEEARHEFEHAAERQASPVAALTLTAMILELEHRQDDAQRQYERVLALEPRAAVAANNLAWLHLQKEDNLDLALQLAQSAKAELPDNAQVSDTLGWIYVKKGLPSLAVPTLRQSAAQNPYDPSIRYHLAVACWKNGDRHAALDQLQQALGLSPAFPEGQAARQLLEELTH